MILVGAQNKTLFKKNMEAKLRQRVLLCINLTSCGLCHSLWDLSKGFNRLGCSGIRLDVFSCSILDLALLHRKSPLQYSYFLYLKVSAHDGSEVTELHIKTYFVAQILILSMQIQNYNFEQ